MQRLVELVIRHAQEHPGKSLGAISMGIKHAMRVQGALDLAQSTHPELAEFFTPGRSDRFFVTNLERVQDDERDYIILTVGYGKDRAGNLPLRLGPNSSCRGHAPPKRGSDPSAGGNDCGLLLFPHGHRYDQSA